MRHLMMLAAATILTATAYAAPQRKAVPVPSSHRPGTSSDWLFAIGGLAVIGSLRRPRSTRSVSS